MTTTDWGEKGVEKSGGSVWGACCVASLPHYKHLILPCLAAR